MAIITRASTEWLIQPPGQQSVDWDNPLAEGLVGLVSPTTSTVQVLFGGNYKETASSNGLEFSTINLTSTERAAYLESPADIGVAGEATILVMFRRFSGSTVAPVVFQENTNIDGYERARSSFTIQGSNWLWRTRDVATGDTGVLDDLKIAAPVNGRLETRMFTLKSGDKRAYLNGKLDTFSTTGQPFTDALASAVTFCSADGIAANNHTCHVALYAAFRGVKTEDAALELYRNPWQLLKPNRRKRFYLPTESSIASSFWYSNSGVPTRSLGLQAFNGTAFVKPSAKIWDGTAWQSIQ